MIRQKSFEKDNSKLYLVPTPIGNLSEMTPRSIEILKSVDYIAAEDTRNTIRLLNHFDIKTKMISHHEHNWKVAVPKIINLLQKGSSIALVSDAGYPAISDPGYELVAACIKENIDIICLSGPNAALNALVISGLVPQPFTFIGFLAHDDKIKKKELEKYKVIPFTTIYYESPHRIKKTLKLMLDYFGNRSIAICRELTKKYEEIIRGSISEVLEIVDEFKGEIVIIVEGNNLEEETSTEYNISIKEHIDKYINEGLSTKDAIKKVADERKLKKNQVYNEYHHK